MTVSPADPNGAATRRHYDFKYAEDDITQHKPRIASAKQDASRNMAGSERSNITIAVDPVALITTECITVTSAMRKHARWAHSSVAAILGGAGSGLSDRGSSRLLVPNESALSLQRGSPQTGKVRSGTVDDDDGLVSHWGRRGKKGKSMQDNPLMSAFARLRSDLRGCTGEFTEAEDVVSILTSYRYSNIRYTVPPSPLPPSHPFILYVSFYHVLSNRSNHEALRLQNHCCRLSAPSSCYAAPFCRHHSLSF